MIRCSVCNTELSEDAKICYRCGNRIHIAQDNGIDEKNRETLPDDEISEAPSSEGDNGGDFESEHEIDWDSIIEDEEPEDAYIEVFEENNDIDVETHETGESDEDLQEMEDSIEFEIEEIEEPIEEPEFEIEETETSIEGADFEITIEEDYISEEEDVGVIELGEGVSPIPKIKNKAPKLRANAQAQVHSAWLKVNNLKKIGIDTTEIEATLKNAMDSSDYQDKIAYSKECLEKAQKLEEDYLSNRHKQLSDEYHVVLSNINTAKGKGLYVADIEDILDSVSSALATREYDNAEKYLRKCKEELEGL